MSLQTSALIVCFNASQWTARKLDKKITDEVNTSHSASTDAGRYNKLLFAKDKTEPISKVINAARTYHYDVTLPWGDNGDRLLASDLYLPYVTKMAEFKNEFLTAVSHFFKNYESFMMEERVRLNGMFKDSDYPSRGDIQNKFDFRTSFMPVPTRDIRVSLDDNNLNEIRKGIESEINSRLTAAVDGIWERIKTQLAKMYEKMRDDKAIFRDSLFENLKDLITLLPALNVTNDVNITKVCKEMAKLVENPENVRNNPALRATKADEVEQVMNKFKGFM